MCWLRQGVSDRNESVSLQGNAGKADGLSFRVLSLRYRQLSPEEKDFRNDRPFIDRADVTCDFDVVGKSVSILLRVATFGSFSKIRFGDVWPQQMVLIFAFRR